MSYAHIERRLQHGGIVILDGGTGSELGRRGVSMDPQAWCGRASLQNVDVLQAIHRDYIAAGADIITANTYASSRLMLGPAGLADQFEEINRNAIAAARRARADSGRDDVLIAGSLSQMCPFVSGSAQPDLSRAPSQAEMAAGFSELALLLRDEGCDLILVEMMYYPERIGLVFEAAMATGLPVWAGFSARRGEDGRLLSFAPEREVPFAELIQPLDRFAVAVAGVMHTRSDIIGDALDVVRGVFTKPLMAYPDSGYFAMPEWRFEDIIPPAELQRFALDWIERGAQVLGGCCGLSPEHIAALAPLKRERADA